MTKRLLSCALALCFTTALAGGARRADAADAPASTTAGAGADKPADAAGSTATTTTTTTTTTTAPPADTAAPSASTNGAGTSVPVTTTTTSDSASSTSAGVPMVAAAAQQGKEVRYGFSLTGRWISVPKWMLNIFTAQNVPLSSYAIGGEFFRRSGNFDFVVGVTWESLSPSDGNWLGKNHAASSDTDFTQFKGLGVIGLDASLILHTNFNEYVSLHYGGGLGIGVVTGSMYRISDGGYYVPSTGMVYQNDPGIAGEENIYNECGANPSDISECRPAIRNCAKGPCTEALLAATQGGQDNPGAPSRFKDNHVPSVIPIVNLVVGLTFKIPGVPGLEMRAEGGFYAINFFLGGAIGYRI